jgi:uncharacterized protein (UPF0261 family)
MSRPILAIATMDTKGQEIAWVANMVRAAGAEVRTVDVGTGFAPVAPPDIPREEVARCHPRGADFVLRQSDRGQAVTAMSEALVAFLTREHREGRLAGVLGLGGSGGTALLAPGFRALPIGMPKVLVSTVASGNTAPYLEACDITLVPSVVDVEGLNSVSTAVLAGAARAVAGMVLFGGPTSTSTRPAVGMTMFGVTTPCVTAVRQALEAHGLDVLVFHATGIGGRAMEKLVADGLISGVLDLTTTEVADEMVGGIFPSGPDRFEAIIEKGVPYVVSVGALDMVNFGARPTVPAQFQGRKLHVHNAQVTLMRTTAEENQAFARWIAGKLNRSRAPLTVLIPEKGVSALDAPGRTFHDPEADAALFEELERSLKAGPDRRLVRLPMHINDPEFARAAVEEFLRLWGGGK